jgi:dTDP-4-dehydrorhamnose reductase
MIIGNGLLGNGFKNSKYNFDDYIIFTSGVSNSKENDIKEFEKEKNLLVKVINENSDLKLIYFSSLLIVNSENEYYRHKLEIENLIKKNTDKYIIFRVPQIVGKIGNPNNLVNFIKNSIINKNSIEIYGDVERSLIYVNDLVNITFYCFDKVNSTTLFLSGIEKIKVIDLCHIIGDILNIEPIYNKINTQQNDKWVFENSDLINESINKNGICKNDYTKKILKNIV